MSSVVLVGNHYSAKQHEVGELIDSHDIVVRFGWYDLKPENYKYLGSRTDIWVTNQFDPLRAKKEYLCIFNYGFSLRPHLDKNFNQIHKSQEDKFGKDNFTIYRPITNVFVDMDNYAAMKQRRLASLVEDPEEFRKYSSFSYLTFLLVFDGKQKNGLVSYRGDNPDDCKIPLVKKVSVYGWDWWGMSKGTATPIDSRAVSKGWIQKYEINFMGSLWLDGLMQDLNPESDFYNPPIK